MSDLSRHRYPRRVIRRAAASDLPALLPLVAAFYEEDRHDYDEGRVLRALRPLLADDTHGQVWVCDTGSRLSAYAVVTWSWSLESGGQDCILDEIYVDPDSRGTGSALLETVLHAVAQAGAAAMFLETEAHNARVRGFYARHGFDVEDSVWMSRPLGG